MPRTDKVCFDRILPSELRRPHSGRMMMLPGGPTRAAFQIAKLWPNGSVIRIGFMNGSTAQKNMVKQFAPQWTQFANLTFQFGDLVGAQVRVAFNDDGAWSYIGTDALSIPSNEPTLNLGWQDEGVILHEFGHMIGLIHEHQSPIGNPIQWNKPVVNAALSGPPNNWPQDVIDHNMYAKYETSQINGSQFDAHSVMLYSFPASWTTNGFHSDPNEVLSAVDKQFSTTVYPQTPVTQGVVDLPVAEAVEAEIGQPAEEDLFKMVARTPGRYVIETDGPTDLVMSLYDLAGNLLAQDDDSGAGRNPRITAQLTPGEYKVQVRHYNTSNGTGSYSIRAAKG
ncbi:MAG: M12 family metallopeptidase [Bryobacteraceae bacterium]